MKTKKIDNLVFSYTNKSGYTSTIYVTRITEKSVFYRNYPAGRLEMRMSKRSFSIYSPAPAL